MEKIEDARAGVERTRLLINFNRVDSSSSHTLSHVSTVRIPSLPSFRGNSTDSINDAFEFLGKEKAIFCST